MKCRLFVLKQFIEDLKESIKAVIECVKTQCQNQRGGVYFYIFTLILFKLFQLYLIKYYF